MTEYLGQQHELNELDKILQSLLQINGSLSRLNTETDEVSIVLPKLDWLYIVRIIEQNKTIEIDLIVQFFNTFHYMIFKNL